MCEYRLNAPRIWASTPQIADLSDFSDFRSLCIESISWRVGFYSVKRFLLKIWRSFYLKLKRYQTILKDTKWYLFLLFGNFLNMVVNPVIMRVQRHFLCNLPLRKMLPREVVHSADAQHIILLVYCVFRRLVWRFPPLKNIIRYYTVFINKCQVKKEKRMGLSLLASGFTGLKDFFRICFQCD